MQGGEQTDPHIHLPVEGRTRWPFVMRVMAFGSAATFLLFSIIYFLLLAPQGDSVQPQAILVGLFFLLFSELVFVRFLIIPAQGDYGRFRITDTRVDFFPLSRYGFSVLTEPEVILLSEFTGISLRVGTGRGGMYYDVFFNHPERRRTIKIRSFETKAAAEFFARTLADTIGVKFLPLT